MWLPCESPEAVRALNRAIGRDERRALTRKEGACFARYAAQWDGEVSTAHLARLGSYLLAHPRYDSREEVERSKVPEGSLLRRRKQFLPRLFEDLPNQAEFAELWAAEREKKSRPRPTDEIEPCPVADYSEFAVEHLGWAPSAGLTWEQLHPQSRKEWWAAWGREQRKKEEQSNG